MSYIASLVIASVTYYDIVIGDGLPSATQAVSCTKNYSFVEHLGQYISSHPTSPSTTDALAVAKLTSDILITVSRATTDGALVVRVALVQLHPRFVLQINQEVDITLAAGVTQADAAITAVGSKAFLVPGGWQINGGTLGNTIPGFFKFDATTIRANRFDGTASSSRLVGTVIDLR